MTYVIRSGILYFELSPFEAKVLSEVGMEIERRSYLEKLVSYQWNGQIKVVTGIRRCGKSYLLGVIYKNYLIAQGVAQKCIIEIALDLVRDIKYRNPLVLAKEVRALAENKPEKYYLFIDEIQMSDIVDNPYNPQGKKITFYDALNDLNNLRNLDIYVTGSNSKMLSSDVLTEFRGRSDEVRVHPLSFSEYYAAVGGDKYDAFDSYATFGGMPLIPSRADTSAKMQYLSSLFQEVYLKDIVERKRIEHDDVLSQVLDLLCSSVGSLTNPKKIADTLCSKRGIKVSQPTIKAYIDYLTDAFLFAESKRYDVKGKAYFDYPQKYYCEDVGLRNARVGFRQQEITHITENIIYNELVSRGYTVDVGIVYARELNANANSVRVVKEIDFVANGFGKRLYIQSAYAMETEEKQQSELLPFKLIEDNFLKIVVGRNVGKRWYDERGILHIDIIDFLLDKNLGKDIL